jgi:hypothetical protein
MLSVRDTLVDLELRAWHLFFKYQYNALYIKAPIWYALGN